MPTGYHVSGPFSSNISADLAKVVSDQNDSPRFLGERRLWTQQVVMLLIWDPPDGSEKKAMSKAYLGQQEMPFPGEHMISKMGGVTSPEVPSSVWLILGRCSHKSPSWPSVCLGGKALWSPLLWLPAYVGSGGLLLGFVNQKIKR